jgi:hypothetical protein
MNTDMSQKYLMHLFEKSLRQKLKKVLLVKMIMSGIFFLFKQNTFFNLYCLKTLNLTRKSQYYTDYVFLVLL